MNLGFPKPDIRGELQNGNNMPYKFKCRNNFWSRGLKILVSKILLLRRSTCILKTQICLGICLCLKVFVEGDIPVFFDLTLPTMAGKVCYYFRLFICVKHRLSPMIKSPAAVL
jgi:hypothetical protein